MPTMKAVRTQLSDTATLARFVANPKAIAAEMGVTDEKGVRDLERLAFSAQNALNAAGASAGLQMKKADWGIGAGCCNSKIIALSSFQE